MTVEVFHLVISKEAREIPETMKAYFDIVISGKPEVISDVLKNEGWAEKGLRYVKVADVDGKDPETAFEKTNHIDSHWQNNSGVTVAPDSLSGARSTSTGDVMRIDSGPYIVCSPFGFTDLEDSEEAVSEVQRG